MFATNELLWFIWVFPSVYLPLSGISSNGSLCASIGNTVRGYSRYHRHQLFWCTTMKLYGQHEWFVSDNDTTMRFEYWAASSEEGRWGQSLLKIEWRQLAASNKAAMKTGTCFINNCLQCHYDKKNINETSIGMRITFLTFQLPGYRYSGCWCSQHHRQQDAHTHTPSSGRLSTQKASLSSFIGHVLAVLMSMSRNCSKHLPKKTFVSWRLITWLPLAKHHTPRQ